MNLKASYHTLGCKLNFSETATIAAILENKGIRKADKSEVPDLCLVNTCSVTGNADKKGRRLIRSLHSKYPDAAIIVTGCYAQLKPDEVARLPGVVIVLGSNEKLKISQYIDALIENSGKYVETTPFLDMSQFIPSCEKGDRTRYFLKVQDGCDYYCTYCTIPYARGRSRSGTISQLVEMAREVACKGGKEIVLTGVNIGTFGIDHGEDFFSLLRQLDLVSGIERYRISSIEPNLLTDEIIQWIASEARAFMPHFHIPLQSGSDKVLKLMNRRYDTSLFASRIELIKKLIPDAFIGVDIIAGARGETDEEWQNSLEFIKSLDVSKLHAFPYSEREGTKALLLGQSVDVATRYNRVSILNELSTRKNQEFLRKNLSTTRKVLWEKPADSILMHGLTDNYIRVEAPLRRELLNNISEVRLFDFKSTNPEIVTALHSNE